MRKTKAFTIYLPADVRNRLEARAMDLGQRMGMTCYPSQVAVRDIRRGIDRWEKKRGRQPMPQT